LKYKVKKMNPKLLRFLLFYLCAAKIPSTINIYYSKELIIMYKVLYIIGCGVAAIVGVLIGMFTISTLIINLLSIMYGI
jgi:hypothetical protein